MKELLFWVVILFVYLFVIGGLKISLNPFSIQMPLWREMVGLVFIIIGVIFFRIQQENEKKESNMDGYRQGCADMRDGVEEILNEIKAENAEKQKINEQN